MGKVPYIKVTRREAKRYHIPARVLVAQQKTESGFNPKAVSSAGAFGLTQFMPGTAAGYHVKRGSSKSAVESQIHGQAKYLHDLGASHNLKGALASYAGGPGNPQASYANLVIGRSKAYRGIGKGAAAPGGSGGGRTAGKVKTKTIPGVNRSADRKTMIADYLLGASAPSKDPFTQGVTDSQNLLNTVIGVAQAKDTPATKVKVRTQGKPAAAPGKRGSDTGLKGTAVFEGKRVAAWIKPELEYARRHGWKGTVTSGFRSYQDQVRIYNSGVRPAAKPGQSNHEGANFPRGAVDVSDAQTLSRILSRKGSKLKFAGAKDPVHFSHPHGGSY